MLLKLYERSAEGTVKEKYKNIIRDFYHIVKIQHCNNCGVDLAGEWDFFTRRLSVYVYYIFYDLQNLECKEGLWSTCQPEREYFKKMENLKEFFDCFRFGSGIWDFDDSIVGYRIRHLFEKENEVKIFDEKEKKNIFFDLSDIFIQHIEEIKTFDNMKQCPVCGATLIKNENTYISKTDDYYAGEGWYERRISRRNDKSDAYYKDSFEYQYNLFTKNITDEINNTVEKKYNLIVERANFPSDESYLNVESIKNDPEKLKKFISNIVNIENNIYSVCERLKELYELQAKNSYDVVPSLKLYQRSYRLEFEKKKEIHNKVRKNITKVDISSPEFAVEVPEPPLKPKSPRYPFKPSSPVYVKVNLFNKKKATALNEEKKEKYDAELKKYEEACKRIDEEYNSLLVAYDKKIAEYNNLLAEADEKRNQMYEARVKEIEEEANEKKKKAKKELDLAKKKYDEVLAQEDSILTPEIVKQKIIENEISQAEETLKKLYSVLNSMYDCGVIFVKYRNFVACSSFSEYLEAGRCLRLDGPEGAYNIYESEIRMNMVISQLSQVVESLEQIKQNQFLLYSVLKEVNSQLSILNDTTHKMLNELGDIKTNTKRLEDIANNTAVSAYNSQISAFYAKKNAELTNSLGFMLAFK